MSRITEHMPSKKRQLFAEIFGSVTAGRVLLFLARHGEGYTREIASTFGVSPQMVHEQLLRFERAGLMSSRRLGTIRLFAFDPAHPLHNELLALLHKAFDSLPIDVQRLIARQPDDLTDESQDEEEIKEPSIELEKESRQIEDFLRRM